MLLVGRLRMKQNIANRTTEAKEQKLCRYENEVARKADVEQENKA